jgi:eukaryotic-like serine/threonine-protein kinase
MPACLEEDVILAFVEGCLDPDGVRTVEAHARTCPSCGEIIATALGAMHGGGARPRKIATAAAVVRGNSIGRYVVLDQVGRGGMGEVFAAYDPELDRRVALKLLHLEGRGGDQRGSARLLREAKAIARLSHPNVVVVHDAGTFDDRVFVAMEFVEGRTLAAWLAERPRAEREILTVFAAAARGLGAAHAAGIVHRDFKPQNVMVSAAGQVRVMDFGLASPVDSNDSAPVTEAPVAEAGVAEGAAPSTWALALTRSGETLGTPLYMAPEQFAGRRAETQTDQFSFCVALYQALYGAHPFRCETLAQLMADVSRGVVRPPPPRSAVPTWLRRVLLRGLDPQPAARWPSMDALVTALAHDPARTRRRAGAVAIAVLVAVTAGMGVWRAARRGESLCGAGPAHLAGLWETQEGGARRERVHQAFLATGLPYVAETWTRTAALLDRYVTEWLNMYRDACEATHRRGEQSAEVLDLRMTCLDERRTRLGALIDVLSNADREAVSRAVDAATALPRLESCADLKLLRSPVEPPADETTAKHGEALRARAAVVDALNTTGNGERGYALGRQLIGEARALGYRPLLAELLERLWAHSDHSARENEAARDLEEAAWMALGERRDDVAAEAGALLSGVVGFALARHEEGERWAAFAGAVLQRLGPGHDLVRAWVLQNRGVMLTQAHRLDEALTLALQARALKERLLPPGSPDIAIALNNEAEILAQQGDAARALARNLLARDSFLRAYGPGSPWLAHNSSNRGEYLASLGRFPEAIGAFETALSSWEAQLGPEHRYLGYPLTGIGVARWKQGHFAQALPPLERALRIREAHEPDAATVAETRFALARALWDEGQERARARRLAEAAGEAYAREPSQAEHAGAVTRWLAGHRAR